MTKWIEGKIKDQSAKKLSEEPVFSGKDVEQRFKPIQKLYKKTLGKKAPKVEPKDEEKKEEKKEDKKDEDKKTDDKKKDDTKDQKKDLWTSTK